MNKWLIDYNENISGRLRQKLIMWLVGFEEGNQVAKAGEDLYGMFFCNIL